MIFAMLAPLRETMHSRFLRLVNTNHYCPAALCSIRAAGVGQLAGGNAGRAAQGKG